MISQAGPYFSRVLKEMCEQKLAPTGTIPTKFWGSISSNDTKMIFFWLKLDHLLLRFHRKVKFFSLV